MKTSRGMFFVFIYLAAASAAAAEKAELGAQADAAVAPTVEVEQQQLASDANAFAVRGIGYLTFKAAEGDGPGLDLFLAQAEFHWTDGTWGVYATPRLKVQPLSSPNSNGLLFLQQTYGFWRHPWGEVKVGKIYQRLGRLWDYGFYGPLIANYDLKQQPDLGVAFEGAPEVADCLRLEYAAQYFALDGRSLSVGNSQYPLGINARHRNIVVARAAPTYHFEHAGTAALGVSGERYDVVVGDPHQVLRGAVDAEVVWGPWNAFAEVGRQDGNDIVYATAAGITSYNYFFAGAAYKTAQFNVRYHYNVMRYDDGSVEYMHQPGAEYNFNDHVGLMLEAVWWASDAAQYAAVNGRIERSIYVVADAKF